MVLTKQIELRAIPHANLLNDVPADQVAERNILSILKLFAILAKGAEVAQLQWCLFLSFILNADHWNLVASHCFLDEIELFLGELIIAAINKIEEHRVDGIA